MSVGGSGVFRLDGGGWKKAGGACEIVTGCCGASSPFGWYILGKVSLRFSS